VILAYDVTDRAIELAWRGRDGVRHRLTRREPKSSNALLPLIDEAIRACGEPVTKLGAVRGPGSFTGIRVGLATAMGLQRSLDAQAFGFDKFMLAAAFVPPKARLWLPSGRSQALCARFQDGRLAEPPRVMSGVDLAPSPDDVCLGEVPGARPLALHTAERCLDFLESDIDPSLHPLEPLYIRPADAKRNQTLLEKLLTATPDD